MPIGPRCQNSNGAARQFRHGSTAVEMAVVTPVLLLLIFGLFEFSRMVWIQQAITNAAREGCRKAVLVTTTSKDDADAEVRAYLEGTIAAATDVIKVRVSVTPENLSELVSHEKITTTVAVHYSDVSFYPPWFLGSTELRGTATMERE